MLLKKIETFPDCVRVEYGTEMTGALYGVEMSVDSQFLHFSGHFSGSGHTNQKVCIAVEKKMGESPLSKCSSGDASR